MLLLLLLLLLRLPGAAAAAAAAGPSVGPCTAVAAVALLPAEEARVAVMKVEGALLPSHGWLRIHLATAAASLPFFPFDI